MKSIIVSLICLSQLFSQAQIIYGTRRVGEDMHFGTLNSETGTFTTITEYHNVHQFYSAYDEGRGHYITVVKDENNNFRLYTIDVTTGELLYNPVIPTAYKELSYSCNLDRLFAFIYGSDYVEIDRITGETRLIRHYPGIYCHSYARILNDRNNLFSFNAGWGTELMYTIDLVDGELLAIEDMHTKGGFVCPCEDSLCYNLQETEEGLKFSSFNPLTGEITSIIDYPDLVYAWLSTPIYIPEENAFILVITDSSEVDIIYKFSIPSGEQISQVSLNVSGIIPMFFFAGSCCFW